MDERMRKAIQNHRAQFAGLVRTANGSRPLPGRRHFRRTPRFCRGTRTLLERRGRRSPMAGLIPVQRSLELGADAVR